MAAPVPAMAQTASAPDWQDVQRQLDSLKAVQAETQAKIDRLEQTLAKAQGHTATDHVADQAVRVAPTPVEQASIPTNRFDLSGDLRLRYEANRGDQAIRNRDRSALRGRLRASYEVANWLTVGAQLSTGDPDDPNSADVTLSNFDDDLMISLDQAYLRATFGGVEIVGGKMPLPFVRTDMVWDSDVSPQGLATIVKLPLAQGSIRASALYFLVDEAVAGPDSRMIGGQIIFELPLSATWRSGGAVAYYDYALRSVADADAGDFRSNLRRPDGRYLSDFNLVDAIAWMEYRGLSTHWPVRLTGNIVQNTGAATGEDSGFGIDLSAGSLRDKNDVRVGYGYSRVETDAVLAAFSQDNTSFATNYRQHAFSFDYALKTNVFINATWYRNRMLRRQPSTIESASHWVDRLRMSVMVVF